MPDHLADDPLLETLRPDGGDRGLRRLALALGMAAALARYGTGTPLHHVEREAEFIANLITSFTERTP